MSYETIIFEKKDGIATITLNRPENLNALNLKMGKEFAEVCESCLKDPDVKVVVITGAGRAFCSGGDLKAAKEFLETNPQKYFQDLTKFFHSAITDIRRMPKPVIASINGPAGGAGFSLALACDLRIASEKAFFKQAYTSVGLTPDGGWTYFLPRLIGLSKVFELVFLDKILDAKEAEKLGIIHKVVLEEKLMETTYSIAKNLVEGATIAFAESKKLLNETLHFTLETQLENERRGLVKCAGTEDFREGLIAFLERKKPKFKGK